MKKFYMTFGQQSPFRNGWVVINASDEVTARKWANNYPHWAGMYSEKPSFLDFSEGQIGEEVNL